MVFGIVGKHFSDFNGNSEKFIDSAPSFTSSEHKSEKDIEQTHIAIAFDAYGYNDLETVDYLDVADFILEQEKIQQR